MEKKGFYAREFSIFVAGYLCGGIVFVIFIWLLKAGYVIPAWVTNTAPQPLGALPTQRITLPILVNRGNRETLPCTPGSAARRAGLPGLACHSLCMDGMP